MGEQVSTLRGYERIALSHELAVLIGYGQMIEILSGNRPFPSIFPGPMHFVLACSLLITMALLPVQSIVRGRSWSFTVSWIVAAVCIMDGCWFLLVRSSTGFHSGVVSSLGLLVAGLFLVNRLLRYSGIREWFRNPSHGHPSGI